MANINNYPDYATEYPYITVTLDSDGEFWFYGAYRTWDKANEVAQMIDGIIVIQ